MSSHSSSQDPQPQSLWKSMVSKLLGPEPGAPLKPLSDPNDLDGLDLDLLPPEPAKPTAKSPPHAPVRPVTAVTFDADDDELEDDAPAAATDEPPEVFFSDEADAVDEDLQAPPEEALPEEKPGDSYWDALSGLNATPDADEPREAARGGGRGPRGGGGRGDRRGGGGGGGRSGGGRSSGSRDGGGRRESSRSESRRERPARDDAPVRERTEERGPERTVERTEERRPRTAAGDSGKRSTRPAPVSPDLFGDDDFGVGLTEESRAQIEAAETTTEPDVESSGGEGESGDRPRRRRGRRGRRGRGREREDAALPASDVAEPEAAVIDGEDDPVAEVDFEAPPRQRSEPRPPVRSAAPVDFEESPVSDEPDDGFGAGLSSGAPRRAASAEEEPRERPRRGRRGRGGAGSREPLPAAESTRTPVDAPVEEEADDAGDSESAEDRRDRYRNIPTWEEAISYLVRPKRRSRDSGRSGGRSSRGHSR